MLTTILSMFPGRKYEFKVFTKTWSCGYAKKKWKKKTTQQQNKYSSVEFMLNELAIIVC